MKKRFLLWIFLLLPISLSALTLEEGNLKLVVDDETGAFVLYHRARRIMPWVALTEDSFTGSYFSISYNGEWINLSLDPRIQRWVENDGLGINLHFHDPRFQVNVRMELIQQGETDLQNYLRCRGSVQLKGGGSAQVGLRYLLDTRFSVGTNHYMVGEQSIGQEFSFRTNQPSYLLNMGNTRRERLYMPLDGVDFGADEVVISNWYRMDRYEGIPFETVNGRALDYHPYSINDGGLGYYWDIQELSFNGSRRFQILYGVDKPETENDFVLNLEQAIEEEEAQQEEGLEEAPSQEDLQRDRDLAIRVQIVQDHMDYIQEYLDELNYIIESGQTLSENDIFVLQEKLEILEDKKSNYEDLQ